MRYLSLVVLGVLMPVVLVMTLLVAVSIAGARDLNGEMLAYSPMGACNRQTHQLLIVDLSRRVTVPLVRECARMVMSSDGRSIAYTTTQGLYVTGIDSFGQRRLLAENVLPLGWTSGDTEVVFQRQIDTYAVSVADRIERQLYTPASLDYNAWSATWSPDGERIAFVSDYEDDNDDVYVMDVDTGEVVGFTDLTSNVSLPVWMPDSHHLMYVSYRDGGRMIYLTDGVNEAQPVFRRFYPFDLDWSADGQLMALVGLQRNGAGDIYVVEVHNGNIVNVTDHPGDDSNPRWSPDGNWIAFTTNRDGFAELYVMDNEGGNLQRLTKENCDVWVSTVWAPNSRYVAYQGCKNWRYSLRVFDLETGETREIVRNWRGFLPLAWWIN